MAEVSDTMREGKGQRAKGKGQRAEAQCMSRVVFERVSGVYIFMM